MSEEEPPRTPPTHGVFFNRGMRVGIPAGGLTISLGGNGEPNAQLVLHAALDVTPHWLGIALSHLQVAEQEHPKLALAWQQQANEEIAKVLEAEVTASMQAMMAASIGVDAFYAAVKEHVPIPEATLQAWRDKGTARHRQVYEVLRRGFKIGKGALPKVREALKEIYRFRDLAVHPDPKLAQPLIHPDLGVGTEWRFVYFRFENAKALVNVSLSLIVQLLNVPNDKNKDLKRYAAEARALMQSLVHQWESRYDSLYRRPDSTPVDSEK
jgi:hypothetical protein